MKLVASPLPGVVVVEPTAFGDDRGWFMESFNEQRWQQGLATLGHRPTRPFVQDNHSCSQAGVLRGLHYQLPPHPQGKLVRVVKGSAWDVAVDIRQGSPTFGQWFGLELNASNRLQLFIPEGFAHGFVALEDDTHFLYKTTDHYAKACERSIRWDDARIAINWPLPAGLTAPLLAPKDAEAPTLDAADLFEFGPY
ncbi:MAG: dTDP-4-dehydrorhamnose 3,5-epimerase [Rubrivivax sp.]